MAAKARKYVPERDSTDLGGGESTGVSILWVPDPTFKILSDAAAERNMSVSTLIAEAVSAYLLPPKPQTPPESEPEPDGGRKPKLMRFD
jgi:hypothetical protein